MRRKLLKIFLTTVFIYGCIAPPVTKNKEQPNEEADFGGLENYMEYHRYLREVVNTLESDPDFKKKLEKASEDDIRSGKIAHELEFVNHHVRTRLDEIKRTELDRLRELMERKANLMENNSIEDPTHHHLDHENPHTFEIEDLKKLIAKTTEDLAEADRKRREEFKHYELQKEYDRQQKLNETNGDERVKLESEYKEMEEKHKKHEKLHEPGHKQQLEEVWEEQDNMQQEFNPKTFFMLHDLDSNGLWDETEVKALFIKELDKMYQAGAPEDDMRERAEEMERMRESVFREVDVNKDGFIDYNEFIAQTKRNDFQQDHGWQGLDEQKPYTDEELEEYIRQHQAQQAYYQQQHMPHPGQMPPPGMAYPGQVPPPGMAVHPGQVPQGVHPGQMAQPGQVGYGGQMNHPGQVPHGQYPPQYNSQVPQGGYQQQNIGHGQAPPQMQPQVPQVPQGQMQQVPQGQVPHHPQGQMPHAPQGYMPQAPQGQMQQIPQGQVPQMQQENLDHQGNIPQLNTNEIYPNHAQHQQVPVQPNQGNQVNAAPQAQGNIQPQQQQQPNYQNQPVQQNQPIQQNQPNYQQHLNEIPNHINKDAQH